MGLRCLLGHDFGPPEIEREREEAGDEMVVTVREVETCRRCGEERVVSENKEVTAIRSPSEVDLDEGNGGDAAGSAERVDAASEAGEGDATAATDATSRGEGAGSDGSTAEAGGVDAAPEGTDDGVILDDGDDGRARGEWHGADESTAESADRVDASAEAVADAPADASDAPDSAVADEDAEFIDADDADDADDEPEVERADAADPAAAEAESWPDHEGDDEGFDADQTSGGGPEDVSFGGGLTPEAGGGAATDRDHGEYVGSDGRSTDEDPEADAFDDIVRVESEAKGDSAETEYFCPNCGLTEPAAETSMRVGDICPSCHKGYVAERDA